MPQILKNKIKMEQNINFKEAWNSIIQAFSISLEETTKKQKKIPNEIINLIKVLNLSDSIQELLILNIEEQLRKDVVPKFWAFFKKPEHDRQGFQQFYESIEYLFECFQKYDNALNKLSVLKETSTKFVYNQKSLNDALKLTLKSVLLSQLPLDHQTIITSFYKVALKLACLEETNSDSLLCHICGAEIHCSHRDMHQETNKKLGKMAIFEPLVGQTLTNLIYSNIECYVQRMCKDSFDESYIEILEAYLEQLIDLLNKIYVYGAINTSNGFNDELNKKLNNYLYNTYTKIRIDQLFNIIIEYPDSLPALEDLRICLPKTDLKPYLTEILQRSMDGRLLHPGVSTADALTAYIAAIRSLRVLDPSGLLLETITLPVHQYLKSRKDTVRCVVGSLTEEGPNDLAEELMRREAVELDETNSDDTENWESWTPEPVDSVSDNTSNNLRKSDIITMLVKVYGSKDLFVNEYRTLLANRLLSTFSCDTEKEIRYLELLKLRFGDSQLNFCEVMLKDLADSKRINQNIHLDQNDESKDDIRLTALILSAQFWPAFKEEKLELHKKVLERMESYTSEFETLKGSRTLCWKHHLGVVELEIELADRTLNLSVSPVHATILMHFQDHKTWTLDALSKIMHIPSTTLKKKIHFWQYHGIISETEPGIYNLQEEQESNEMSSLQDDIVVEDSESESAMASAQDQREEELQTFWSYITGMLMNLDTLPLERIHQMLKMFAFQGPTIECNIQELKIFLDRKVREHQLIYSNGLYRLPK